MPRTHGPRIRQGGIATGSVETGLITNARELNVTDKEYNFQKKRIGKLLDKWQEPMGLKWWHLDVVWDRSYCQHNAGVAGDAEMNGWRYRRATLTFYLPKLAEEDDETAENVVLHELCHVLLAPISTNMEKLNEDHQVQINEFTTELVTNAIMWTRQAGRDEAAKAVSTKRKRNGIIPLNTEHETMRAQEDNS